MNDYKSEYIRYRIAKSNEAYLDALALVKMGSWNASMNRLYYAAYYIISALLIKNNIETKTHSGVRIQFALKFIKSGILDKEIAKLYSDLFDSRQKGDYDDMFDFDEETIKSLLTPVAELIKTITAKIEE